MDGESHLIGIVDHCHRHLGIDVAIGDLMTQLQLAHAWLLGLQNKRSAVW